MGIPVMILGESGTGKTASLRNCTNDRFGLINVLKKPLPFRSNLKPLATDDYHKIMNVLSGAKVPSIVIDDSQYLMVKPFLARCFETGYGKYTEIAKDHIELIQHVIDYLPPEKIVYFLSHIERDQQGNEKAKTVGKMIDQHATLEGFYTIVLKTHVANGKYTFITHNSGFDTVKTPIGMFEADEIDNDLLMVDDTIREYYGFGKDDKE